MNESFAPTLQRTARLLAVALSLFATEMATAQSPVNPLSYARQNGFEVDMITRGEVTAEVTEPTNLASCVRTAYAFDAYGNHASATTANCSGAVPASALFGSRTTTTAYSVSTMPSVIVEGQSVALVPGAFPISTTNALNQTQTATYDPRYGVALSQTDRNGLTTTWQLDDFGRPLKQTHVDGTALVYFYCTLPGIGLDTSANTPGCPTPATGEAPPDAIAFVHTEPRNTGNVKMGAFSRIYSDRLGRELRTVTEAFDGATQPSAPGSLVVADTRYNPWGAKQLESRPYFLASHSSTTSGSNDVGTHLFVYDVLGRATDVYVADAQGSQASVAFPGFATQRASLTHTAWNGLSATATDDQGHTRTEDKNILGQVMRVTDALGAQVVNQYDAFGNLIATKDALQNIVTVGYDIRGHRLSLVDPDAGGWGYCYDALGQLKAQQNSTMRGGVAPGVCPSSTGVTTQATVIASWATFAYDLLGRMTQRIEPEYTSTWTFDQYADHSACNKGVGELCEVSTSNGVDRRYVYDTYGRAAATRTDVAGGPSFAATLGYDSSTGRLASQTYPTGVSVAYAYTGRGYLEKLNLGTATTIYPLPSTPGGTPVASRALAAGAMLWQAQVLNAFGHPEQQTAADGIVTRTSFDAARGRPVAIAAGAGSASNVLSQTYGWDALRNLTARSDANGDGSTGAVSETFGYDAIGRLNQYTVAATQIPGLARSVTLQYNALGNLLYKSDSAIYSYAASGAGSVRPHAVVSVAGPTSATFTYDNNGNLNAATGGKYASLAYTSFNLPDSNNGIGGPGGNPRYLWSYDENHARIKEVRTTASGVMAGTRTLWYLHPDNTGGLSFESEVEAPTSPSTANPAGTSNRHFLSVGGEVIGVLVTTGALPTLAAGAMAPPAPGGIVTAVKLEYWHKDYLGSISATTDHLGNVTARYAYDPLGKRRYANGQYDAFGTLVIDWNSATNNGTDRGYTGHEQLDDIGLIHMNGRIYDPNLGRMLQADPLVQDPSNLQSTNRYTYGLNNPFKWTDPSGWANAEGCSGGNGGTCDFLSDVASRKNAQLDQVRAAISQGDQPTAPNGGPTGDYDRGSRAAGAPSDTKASPGAKTVSAIGGATRDLLDGGYGRKTQEAINRGDVAGVVGNTIAGAIYGALNIATLGEAGALAKVGTQLISKVALARGEAAIANEATAAANAARGLSTHGGSFSSATNAAGGEVVTSTGKISQNDFATFVNGGLYKGDVNIISGVHGTPAGTTVPAIDLFRADTAAFGSIPGVRVYNFTDMSSGQLTNLLRGPGTTIGGFCDSGACLAPFK